MSDEKDERERQADIVMQIAELAAELDWNIALPDMDTPVSGLIMGTNEWVREQGTIIYGPEFVIFTEDPLTGTMTDFPAGDGGNKLH